MAQHDYVIANDTAANVRADLNNVLQAIVSNNSGPSEPSPTYGNQFWYDTTTSLLKMRSAANDSWITVAYVDQTTDAYSILEDSAVVDASGTQVATLGLQDQATWEAGASTTETLVSPEKVSAAITALGLTNPQFVGTPVEDVYTLSGTSVALEPDNGSMQTHTLTANTTYTDAFTSGQSILLTITAASYTVTWPTISWVNNNGLAPVLSTTDDTVIVVWKISGTLYGALVGNYG